MGYIFFILSCIFVIFSIHSIICILVGKGKKVDPKYDTVEKRNYIFKKGKNNLIFLQILLILHLTIVFIFYSDDTMLSNYLGIIYFLFFIYCVLVSIKYILIGKGKLQNPMYETIAKKKYVFKKGIIELIFSLVFFVIIIFNQYYS
jgi:hypothetical protein